MKFIHGTTITHLLTVLVKTHDRHTSRLSWHFCYWCEQVFIVVLLNDQYSICLTDDNLEFLIFLLKYSELSDKWIFKMYSIPIPIFYNEFKSRFIYSHVILKLEKITSKWMCLTDVSGSTFSLCIRKHFTAFCTRMFFTNMSFEKSSIRLLEDLAFFISKFLFDIKIGNTYTLVFFLQKKLYRLKRLQVMD